MKIKQIKDLEVGDRVVCGAHPDSPATLRTVDSIDLQGRVLWLYGGPHRGSHRGSHGVTRTLFDEDDEVLEVVVIERVPG